MMSIGRYLGMYLINTVEYNEMRKKWECQLNNVNGNIVGRSEENGSGRWSVNIIMLIQKFWRIKWTEE